MAGVGGWGGGGRRPTKMPLRQTKNKSSKVHSFHRLSPSLPPPHTGTLRRPVLTIGLSRCAGIGGGGGISRFLRPLSPIPHRPGPSDGCFFPSFPLRAAPPLGPASPSRVLQGPGPRVRGSPSPSELPAAPSPPPASVPPVGPPRLPAKGDLLEP